MIKKFLHGLALIKRNKPWDHVFFTRVFTTEVYKEMLENLPDIDRFYTLNAYRKVWPLSNAEPGAYWHDVNTIFTSDIFKKAISFQLGITKPFYPKLALVYDLPGYSIERHRDASFKVATAIFYLPEDDSQKLLGDHLLGKDFRKQVGFFPNTGVAFASDGKAWHDVPETPEDSGIRRTLHIYCFDTPDRDFK